MNYWVWFLVCGVVVGWFWYNEKKKMKIKSVEVKKRRGEVIIPRGSLGWPLIGETLEFIACGYTSKPVSFMDKRKLLYGNVFKTNILGTPIIVSTDPEVNKVVLLNHGNVFVPAYPKSITELLGKNSILQMNGNLHKRLHALVGGFLRSPQFKARITRDIEDSVKLTLASWKDMHRLSVQDETKKITFSILVKALMSVGPGEDLDLMKREFGEFIKALICIPIKLPGTRLYKSLKAKERLLKKVRNIVGERKMAMDDIYSGDAKDAVEVLLRESNGDRNDKLSMTLDEISNHIIELMIPGEETMPTAMTLAVKFLTDSPVVLTKLMEENMELRRQKTESSDDYGWIDYMSLAFTQNVISETLRMANIINGVWRKALKDVPVKGYLIPEGWCVLSAFISVHMGEEYYTNPYKFDPWRWEKNGAVANNNNFTPFGGGQRLCPGLELSRLELSIFLHHLVTTYSWVAENDEIVYFPTVKMKRKLPIVVKTIQ